MCACIKWVLLSYHVNNLALANYVIPCGHTICILWHYSIFCSLLVYKIHEKTKINNVLIRLCRTFLSVASLVPAADVNVSIENESDTYGTFIFKK